MHQSCHHWWPEFRLSAHEFLKNTVFEEKRQEVNLDLKCQFGVSGILHT